MQNGHEVALAAAEAAVEIGTHRPPPFERPVHQFQRPLEAVAELVGHHVLAQRLLRPLHPLGELEDEVPLVHPLGDLDQLPDQSRHDAPSRNAKTPPMRGTPPASRMRSAGPERRKLYPHPMAPLSDHPVSGIRPELRADAPGVGLDPATVLAWEPGRYSGPTLPFSGSRFRSSGAQSSSRQRVQPLSGRFPGRVHSTTSPARDG